MAAKDHELARAGEQLVAAQRRADDTGERMAALQREYDTATATIAQLNADVSAATTRATTHASQVRHLLTSC